MVNFHDPIVIGKEFYEIAMFWGLVDGIFIWEFLVTLDYEWSVIRGRRPYRWTIWIYSLTRIATLATVVLNIYSIDVMAPINCQVTTSLQFIFAYLALTTSSLLVALRIIAIWNRKTIIVALATSLWGINVSFLIQGVIGFRASNNAILGCVFNLDSIRLSTIVAFATDTILLLIMLFGLYRLRRHGHGLMALGRFLWNQGVVWLLLVILTELAPMVFIILDLNAALDMMLHVPWVIAMSIAATRMYHSLSDFLSSDFAQNIPPTSGHGGRRTGLEPNGTSTGSTAPPLLTGIQVAVRTVHEQYSTPQANRFGSDVSGHWQSHEKPHELVIDIVNEHDIEDSAEK